MKCPHCGVNNPEMARFCYDCGGSLPGQGRVQPLTFPQNEAATDLLTLADCSARHWDYARKILYDGTVENWLRSVLTDPVAADKAQTIVRTQKDPDVGLDQLIRELNPSFPPPRLQVRAATLDAGSLPWQQTRQLTVDVTNVGHGALQTKVTTTASWLRVTPAAFSCVARRVVRLTVTVDAKQLEPGQNHQAILSLEAGAGGRTQIPVTVTVPAPQLVVDPQVLNLGSTYQGETLTKSFTVRNVGGSAFEGRVRCDKRWASVDPDKFRVEPGRDVTVTITANTVGLAPGKHVASVRVEAKAGRWSQVAAVSAQARLPMIKTLWHRWAPTLDWAAAGMILGLVGCALARTTWFTNFYLHLHLPLVSRVSQSLHNSLIVWLVLSVVGGIVGRKMGRGLRGLVAGVPYLIGSILAATADTWLALAPAVLLVTVSCAAFGYAWGITLETSPRRWSGILASVSFVVVLLLNGYLLLQPQNWWHQRYAIEWSGDCVTFSPDGERLAAGCGSGFVQLWRVSDGASLQTLESSSRGVTFNQSGTVIASYGHAASHDHDAIRLWRVSDGALVRTLEGGTLRCLALSPDGTILASNGYDDPRTIQLRRVADGVLVQTLEHTALDVGSADLVWSVAFSPDGTYLASGTANGTVRLWRVMDGALLYTLEGHGERPASPAFSPDGTILASASADGDIQLWRVSDGTPIRALKAPGGANSIAFSPDGRRLVAGAGDGTVRIWRVADGALLRTLWAYPLPSLAWLTPVGSRVSVAHRVTSVAFSSDGVTVASGVDLHEHGVRLWWVGDETGLQALKH